MTFWLYVALMVLAVVFALIPWGFLLRYGSRLVGFAVLGPHMHYVGRVVDRGRAMKKAEVRVYCDADKQRKNELLEAHRQKLMAIAMEKVKQAQAKHARRNLRELERLRYLETQRYHFINGNTPNNVRIKYAAAADPTRSSANYFCG